MFIDRKGHTDRCISSDKILSFKAHSCLNNPSNIMSSLKPERKNGLRRNSDASLVLVKSGRERRNSGIAEITPTPALPKDDDTDSAGKAASRRSSNVVGSRRNSVQTPNVVQLLKSVRNMVPEINPDGGIDIRGGVLDNIAAVLDPAFPELEIEEHKSIYQLARDGDVKGMELLFERLGTPKSKRVIGKINTLDENKVGILHYAARYEQLEMVKLIVFWGGDVNIRGDDGLSPLHFAARFKIINKVPTNKVVYSSAKYNPASSSTEKDGNATPTTLDIKDILNGKVPPYESNLTPQDSSSVIVYLAQEGSDVNAKDKYGLTPLHYAAMRGNDDAANDLLKMKTTNIEAKDQQKLTPLHLACTYGQSEVAKILLQHGANIRSFGEQHQSALHKACSVGSFDLVQMLISTSIRAHGGNAEIKKMAKDVDVYHNTPLMLAVEGGSAQITDLLIEHGSDVNHCNKSRVFPLHSACTNGSLDIVKILVENSASIDCLNSFHQTPLAVAAAFNHVDIINFLLQTGHADIEAKDKDGYNPLLLAASEGNAEAVDILLKLHADIFVIDKEDRTVLYWAAMQNHKNVIDVLLKDSRSSQLLQASDRFDNTPLHVACERGYHDIALTLIEAGSDVDNKNEDERTPLHLAAREGRVKICKEILKKDAFSIHDEDSESNTALHMACMHGHARVVSTLISYGADIKSRNYFLWTPLDCAAAYGQLKCAKLLIDTNADIDAIDKNKTTPLHLAARYGHEKIAKLLIDQGASVSQKNAKGHNPLVTAILHGNCEVSEVIIESDAWMEAMKCDFTNPATDIRDTPLRLLIKIQPDLAKKVFDKCTETNLQSNSINSSESKIKDQIVSTDDEKFRITFNFELLDDSYTIFNKNTTKMNKGQMNNSFFFNLENLLHDSDYKTYDWHQTDFYDDRDHLLPETEPYTTSSTLRKLNHPLNIMVKEKRVNLLGHPLCMALVRHKWISFGRRIYFLNLFLFLVFIIFLTEFMISSIVPYSANRIAQECEHQEHMTNENITMEDFQADLINATDRNYCDIGKEFCPDLKKRAMAYVSEVVVIGLSIFHLAKELFQVTQARLTYFGFENVIEWVCYVTAILFVIDLNECQQATGLRMEWQWMIGSICVTLSWLNLLSNVRKFPFLGIYVVMFTDVLQTFLKFSIIVALFIVAFAFGFYALLAEQENFKNVGYSMLKTSVMMIGEFEFDDLFFDNIGGSINNGSPSEMLPYKIFTMLFFLAFMVIMPIIIMNLMVGLAVDDIKTVQDNAELSRLAMQVGMALDVERMLPDFIRRRFIVKKLSVFPRKKIGFLSVIAGDANSLGKITKGVVADISSQSEMSQLANRLEDILGKMKAFKDQMKQVSSELEGTKSLMEAMAKKTGIDVIEEDDLIDS